MKQQSVYISTAVYPPFHTCQHLTGHFTLYLPYWHRPLKTPYRSTRSNVVKTGTNKCLTAADRNSGYHSSRPPPSTRDRCSQERLSQKAVRWKENIDGGRPGSARTLMQILSGSVGWVRKGAPPRVTHLVGCGRLTVNLEEEISCSEISEGPSVRECSFWSLGPCLHPSHLFSLLIHQKAFKQSLSTLRFHN